MAGDETGVDELPVGPVLSWAHSVQAGPPHVGGKGWNLGRLARYGFRVPAGGVLTAATYEALVARPSLAEQVAALAAVEADAVDEDAVRERLDRLREAIASEALPDETRLAIGAFLRRAGLDDRPVAVRSSAVAEDGAGTAFAGIHDSVLGVVGADAVCAAVLHCFASLWTPQAVAYRRHFGVADDATPCAVVICDLIGDPTEGSIAAGVAFSCDPVTGERGVVTINLAAGAGEAVVGGGVNPQQYAVRHGGRTRHVERTDAIGAPAVLDDQHIDTLARLVFRVHWALGDGDVPQDVEWAWDGNDFWLLQARPVTRIPRWTFPGVPTRTTTWSNANVRDSFPRPLTVLTWSFVDASAQAIVYASLQVAGYPLPAGMEVMRRFGGRPTSTSTACNGVSSTRSASPRGDQPGHGRVPARDFGPGGQPHARAQRARPAVAPPPARPVPVELSSQSRATHRSDDRARPAVACDRSVDAERCRAAGRVAAGPGHGSRLPAGAADRGDLLRRLDERDAGRPRARDRRSRPDPGRPAPWTTSVTGRCSRWSSRVRAGRRTRRICSSRSSFTSSIPIWATSALMPSTCASARKPG